MLADAWWHAAAAAARLVGDLSVAEDCAQEACARALEQWPRDGVPDNPGGWLVAVARRAVDHLRRESTRAGKEREAVQQWTAREPDGTVVAEAPAGEETIVYGDLDLGRIAEEQQSLDVVGHYNRPDVFTLRVDRTPHRQVAFEDGDGRQAAAPPANADILEI